MTFQIFFACVLPSRANHGLKIHIYLKDDLHIKLWQLSSLSQFLQGSCVWMMFTAHLKMNCITLIWISSRHAHIFWRATEWCSLFHIGRLAFESAYVTCIFLVNCLDRIAFDFFVTHLIFPKFIMLRLPFTLAYILWQCFNTRRRTDLHLANKRRLSSEITLQMCIL